MTHHIAMAQTYSQIQAQIAKLQVDADRLRKSEQADVIAKIKIAIEAYGITPEDLFTGKSSNAGAKSTSTGTSPFKSRPTPASKSKSKSKGDLTPRFADGNGNTWVGRGPRPLWLRDAVKRGKSLADFAVGSNDFATSVKSASGKATGKAAGKASGKAPGKAAGKTIAAKYKDGVGNSWTGRGSQPRWLKAALASGKQLDQFLI